MPPILYAMPLPSIAVHRELDVGKSKIRTTDDTSPAIEYLVLECDVT